MLARSSPICSSAIDFFLCNGDVAVTVTSRCLSEPTAYWQTKQFLELGGLRGTRRTVVLVIKHGPSSAWLRPERGYIKERRSLRQKFVCSQCCVVSTSTPQNRRTPSVTGNTGEESNGNRRRTNAPYDTTSTINTCCLSSRQRYQLCRPDLPTPR
ncbi:uncharacterized protein B0H18DRAFT_556042 [Fomitopsis serialis]|uniref:uncharacterized protein n=1 Tax=Fomitopsis serialis TaxID=139415 RepID=UPI002008995E|nr:uncharacterized protein B0H18DRAFT_556042 [Neoantrodia serialis]KAH9934340.1 hypothetical protein B0H18DRAFT_556042 [Neoantrodia serialis]